MSNHKRVLLEVEFTRTYNHHITGNLLSDPRPIRGLESRTKWVMINGYSTDKYLKGTWQGDLPKDGETWLCEEIRDTKPDEPRAGLIIVKLKKNLTLEIQENLKRERAFLYPITEWLARETCGPDLAERVSMAKELKSYVHYLLDVIDLNDAVGIFEQLKDKTSLTEVLVILAEENRIFVEHEIWSKIQQYNNSEVVRMFCVNGIVNWLQHLLDLGFVDSKRFTFIGDRTFKCSSCNAEIRLPIPEYEKFEESESFKFTCLGCGVEGTAKNVSE